MLAGLTNNADLTSPTLDFLDNNEHIGVTCDRSFDEMGRSIPYVSRGGGVKMMVVSHGRHRMTGRSDHRARAAGQVDAPLMAAPRACSRAMAETPTDGRLSHLLAHLSIGGCARVPLADKRPGTPSP